MDKKEINEIASLVEKQWTENSKQDSDSRVNNRKFLEEVLHKYKLKDSEWEEVINECNRRTDKIERRLWISERIIDPLLKLLSYTVILYTVIFVLISIFNVYNLPAQLLFPNGSYPEREQFINLVNLLIVIIGLFLIVSYSNRRRKL